MNRETLRARLIPFLTLAAAFLIASCSTKPEEEGYDRPIDTSGPIGKAPIGPGRGGPAASASALFESPRKADGAITIRIITNGISPFWDSMRVGMERTAQELGCTANWAAPDPAQIVQQRRRLEEAVSSKVDGIAISAIEAAALAPEIDRILTEEKIPVITMDSDVPQSKRLAYIGTNNLDAGKAAGAEALKLFPTGGKLVGFVGNISAENARERRDGFLEAVKGKNIELLDVMDDNKDVRRARQNADDSITRRGTEIQGLLGFYSYNGPAIAQAVKARNARDRYKVLCFDAEPLTQDLMEQGLIDATVVQKPYEFGAKSVRLLYLINRKGWTAARQEMNIPENGILDTGVRVITPATIKEFREELKALGVTSS